MANLELSRGQRLDQYVVEQRPVLSRAFAVKLIEEGRVLVNGMHSKPGHKVRPTDAVTIEYDNSEHEQIPEIELPIIYEDDDVLVINKPGGVLTHSKGAFNPEATVATFIRKYLHDKQPDGPKSYSDYKTWRLSERAGIVHRLDRLTSGVLICAKNQAALVWLQKQFSQRKAKKVYFAIVSGTPKQAQAVIDMPIARNPKSPATFHASADGKTAVTAYMVTQTDGTHSLLELRPETGRTHQLRVHLKQIGCPIVGDPLYGTEQGKRLYLHAHSLEITLPNRQRKVFEASLPAEFEEFMDAS